MQYEQILFMQMISDAMWQKLYNNVPSATCFNKILFICMGKHHSHFCWLCTSVVCGVSCSLCDIRVVVCAVTDTWTATCCWPAPHQYQPESLISSCCIVTVNMLSLSSWMKTFVLLNVPSESVTTQEFMFPLRHHRFSLDLQGNQWYHTRIY